MAAVINNMRVLESILNRKLRAGVRAAVDKTAELYRQEVTAVKEDGPPFRGPHSKPGEYPHQETGQGADNIGSGVRGLAGKAGVKWAFTGTGPIPPHKIPGGLHLHWLATKQGRKGIDFTLLSRQNEIRSAAKAAMK